MFSDHQKQRSPQCRFQNCRRKCRTKRWWQNWNPQQDWIHHSCQRSRQIGSSWFENRTHSWIWCSSIRSGWLRQRWKWIRYLGWSSNFLVRIDPLLVSIIQTWIDWLMISYFSGTLEVKERLPSLKTFVKLDPSLRSSLLVLAKELWLLFCQILIMRY